MPEPHHATYKRQLQASGKTHQAKQDTIDYREHQTTDDLSHSDKINKAFANNQQNTSNDSRRQQYQLDNLLIDWDDQHMIPTSTTRVLTDEKGHSIKIRIASPPPQRSDRGICRMINSSGELMNITQYHQQTTTGSVQHSGGVDDQVLAGSNAAKFRQQRDSLASDCPLISGNGDWPAASGGYGLDVDENRRDEQQLNEQTSTADGLKRPGEPTSPTAITSTTMRGQHERKRRVSAATTRASLQQFSSNGGALVHSKRRRHSEISRIPTKSTTSSFGHETNGSDLAATAAIDGDDEDCDGEGGDHGANNATTMATMRATTSATAAATTIVQSKLTYVYTYNDFPSTIFNLDN